MKTLLLTAFLVITRLATSQTTKYYSSTKPISTEEDSINTAMYIVGCETMPEYKIEIKTCSIEKQIILSNGRKVPALNCFLIDKSEYVGGKLVSGNKTTEIVDILMEPIGEDGAKFIVKGKAFSMSFTLIDGMILKLEGDKAVFHTQGEGIWMINKKA